MKLVNKPTKKPAYQMRPLRGDYSAYHNSDDYWLLNDSNSEKMIVQDVPEHVYSNGKAVLNADKSHKMKNVQSEAKRLGLTNLLQPSDLPMLAGEVVPPKYWKTVNGMPKLKSPAQRKAADKAETESTAARKHDAGVEMEISKEMRRMAIQSSSSISAADKTRFLAEV